MEPGSAWLRGWGRTTKALRKLEPGPGLLDVVETPEPVPGPGQVLIRVRRAGVCGTDIHIWHGLFGKARPPVTLGHEFAGEVVGLGQGVDEWRLGDRVTVESEAFSCGRCQHCLQGWTNLCSERLAYGYSLDGAFAPLVAVRRDAPHLLPEQVSFEEAALGEPLAVAVHAVMEVSAVAPGQKVLITGPGTIGLIVLQVAKAAGAEVIISGLEADQTRLSLAAELGADHCLRSDRDDLPALVQELTGGAGLVLALECSGAAGGLNDCLACLGRRGEVVQVGLFGRPAAVDLDQAVLKEIVLKGSFAHCRSSWDKAVRLLEEKKVSLKPLISGQFALEDWRRAFELFERGTGLKYLLYCPD